MNFGHRAWWCRGHFCKKAGKNLLFKKKLFPEIILKKGKNWGGSKIRNKLCLKNEVFMFMH